MKYLNTNNGFTLIEVVMAIVIAGILATVAMRSATTITETGRTEITKTEMQDIAVAIVGNSNLQNNNIRNDFGYVGDVGSMPPNLTALMTNPGGYTTWHGPYISNRFSQTASDYSQDAWGVSYTYSGVDITSTGSGSSIVHKIGETTTHFTINKVSGNIYDSDGTPPGTIYKDSISVLLTYPNGVGSIITKGISPDFGGYFYFDSIPIGNQDIQLVYSPTNDTLKRFVSVTPKSSVYDEYLFSTNYWNSTGNPSGNSAIIYVTNSAVINDINCDNVEFQIQNTSANAITLTNLTATYTSTPTSFYNDIVINGTTVWVQKIPQLGTDEIANFTSNIILNANQTVTVQLNGFDEAANNGGTSNMANTNFTITFSDGSIITFSVGSCIA